MNKRIIIAATMAALVLGGCAKDIDAGTYDDESRYLKAWLKADHSDLGIEIVRNSETGLPDTLGRGVYLLSETKGSGKRASSANYVNIHFTERQLSGTINSFSEASTAKQMGTYNKTYYYGKHTTCLTAGITTAGLADAVIGMQEGGTRTVLVPQWLNSSNNFSTEAEYLETSNAEASSVIYIISLEKVIEDFDQYRIDEIETFLRDKVYGQMKFPSDTTIKINYTGYRLDGQAFDTSVEKTSKDHYIWSKDNTYETKSITWADSYSGIQMEGSSLIGGFTKTLWQMNKGRGIGIFWSTLGYGSSASGSRIPAYAPLMFEVEFVEEEE